MTDPEEIREPASSTRAAFPRAAVLLIGLAAFTITAFGLAAIRGIAGPVILAVILVICVNPIRRVLVGRGAPPALATGAVIVTTFALVAAFVAAFLVAFAQFVTLLPTYAPQIRAAIADVLTAFGVGAEELQALLPPFDVARVVPAAEGLLGGVTGVVTFLVILLTSILLMAMDASYLPYLMRHLGVERPHLAQPLRDFATGVRRYMVVTTGLGVAQGLLNWLTLVLLGVPGAFLWGLLSFLCSFIPNVGYFIAIVPPIVFGLLEGGWGTAIAIILVYGLINGVVQSVVQPRIVGDAVSLSQTLTFVSVLFWAVVLGPIGAILSIPLTLLVRMLLIDAGPDARVWRPLTGDVREAKSRTEKDRSGRAPRKARTALAPRRGPGE